MLLIVGFNNSVTFANSSVSLGNSQMDILIGGQSSGNLQRGPGQGVNWYCYLAIFMFAGQVVAGSFAMASNPILGTILLHHLFYGGSVIGLYGACRG